MARPTEPAPAQLDRSGESGYLVTATSPDSPELGTILDVPEEWCDYIPGAFNPNTGSSDPPTFELKAGYMTPDELTAWTAAQSGGGGGDGPTWTPEALTGQTIADWLGYGDDPEVVTAAGQHLPVIVALARSYTRDRGFDPETGVPTEDIAAVVTCATARLTVNPEQNKREALATGDAVTYAGFQGWSLAETIVLNRYRKRAS